MGGDGSLFHITDALIKRTMTDAGLDIDSDSPIKPKITVGVLTGGSGCAVSMQVNGTRDLETCALAIVLGKSTPYDVIGLSNNGQTIGFGNVTMGVGSLSQVYGWLEKFKWMGIHRYHMATAGFWWLWQKYAVEIQYRSVSEKDRLFRKGETDEPCPENVNYQDGPSDGWKTVKGNVSEVSIMPYAMTEFINNAMEELYEPLHLTSGRMLLALYNTHLWRTLAMMRTMMINKRSSIQRSALEHAEVKDEMKVLLTDENLPNLELAIDGEAFPLNNGPQIEMKVHGGLLTFFYLDRDLIKRVELASKVSAKTMLI